MYTVYHIIGGPAQARGVCDRVITSLEKQKFEVGQNSDAVVLRGFLPQELF